MEGWIKERMYLIINCSIYFYTFVGSIKISSKRYKGGEGIYTLIRSFALLVKGKGIKNRRL